MSVEIVTDRNSVWAVDWALVRSIVRSYAHSRAVLQHGRRTRTDQVDWYNPFSWAMPDIVSYEIDWDAVRRDKEEFAEDILRDFYLTIANSVPAVKDRLREMIHRTEENQRQLRRNMQSAQRETSRNIDAAVSTYETAATSARVVRDVSAETVLVGATFMSGGTAAAFIAGGSVMKGTATYQDTGSVGAAMIETTGSVVLTAIPVARSASGARAMTRAEGIAYEGSLVLIDAQFETAKGLASGDTLQQALARGGVKVLTSGASQGIGRLAQTDRVQSVLSRSGIPANIRIRPGRPGSVSRTDLVTGMTSMVVNTQGIGRVAGAIINTLSPQGSSDARSRLAANGGRQCMGSDELCASLDILDSAIRPAECR